MTTKRKAVDLFAPGERHTHILEGRFVVQGTPVTIEHSDNCLDQKLVQARLPGDRRETWGEDIKLPTAFQLATVEQLDETVQHYFNRWPDPLAPCPQCGQLTWNRKHFPSQYRDERCGDCWWRGFDLATAELRHQQEDEQRTRDVAHYHSGMRWRTTCIVHPRQGDDAVIDLYTVERIDAEDAQKRMHQNYPEAVLVEVLPIYQLPSH